MNFLKDIFGRKPVTPCFICRSNEGTRWLGKSTTSSWRQTDKLTKLMALATLSHATNRGTTLEISERVIYLLMTSNDWCLCETCFPKQ